MPGPESAHREKLQTERNLGYSIGRLPVSKLKDEQGKDVLNLEYDGIDKMSDEMKRFFLLGRISLQLNNLYNSRKDED